MIISDYHIASLAKTIEILKLKDLVEFLKLWYCVYKHANKIFQSLEMNYFLLNIDVKPLLQLLFKIMQKNTFQTFWISKKLKNTNDSVIEENMQKINLQN